MRHWLKIILSTGIGLYAATSYAYIDALRPIHFYTRLDLGSVWMSDQTFSSVVGSPPLAAGMEATSESKATFHNAMTGQFGFGYIFSPFARMDLTFLQTGGMDVSTTCTPASACPEGVKGEGQIASGQLLMSGYFDLGRVFRLQQWINPYIGGGIGYAHNKLSHFKLKSDGVEVSRADDSSDNQFAWRVMGGVTFALSHNYFLDFSYTYVNAGTVSPSTVYHVAGSEYDLISTEAINVNQQQFMGGLRYRF